MLLIPYFTGVCLTSSTFTLPTTTLSPNWSQILSKIGAIALHGPHHSAQKSTITSLSELITSSSKFSSVIFTVLSDINFPNHLNINF